MRCGRLAIFCVTATMLLAPGSARASVAYGDLNNFDCVNDTGSECHGFEIELDDVRCSDITYTYDWNHYGTPRIFEDTTSVPGHTNVIIRYAAVWTNTDWSAYTAIPGGPIPPTQGHQFTDPTVNFGGEHFGVGYAAQPSTVKYHWLQDDGSGFGVLTLGPSVSVSTPTFVYYPPVGAQAAKVQAGIQAPEEDFHFREFGEATWVKEIRTTGHTNLPVALRDLLSPDDDVPPVKDWRNGEPDEVEVEWSLLQMDYTAEDGGANAELDGAAEGLPHGDEVVTRRYEFYAYVGPYDPENHEARTDKVGADGIHGTGSYSNTVVVGDFLGAQMSAFHNAAPMGLIDHLPDGEVGEPYPTRTVVIAGSSNFTAATSGALPDGLLFAVATGQISGTPNESGVFLFTVSVSVSNNLVLKKTYPLMIADVGEILPPHYAVDTLPSPADAGTTTGDGVYAQPDLATVVATPKPGYKFANWTENGAVVSTTAAFTSELTLNRSLVANFVVQNQPGLTCLLQPNTLMLRWPTNFSGFHLQSKSSLSSTNWLAVTNGVSISGSNYQVTITPSAGTAYFHLKSP